MDTVFRSLRTKNSSFAYIGFIINSPYKIELNSIENTCLCTLNTVPPDCNKEHLSITHEIRNSTTGPKYLIV
jgi:hypothetical protein